MAAVNASESIVISGASQSLRKVLARLEGQGVKIKRLNASHAFHSPLVEPVLAEFEAFAQTISFSRPRLRIVSSVTGRVMSETFSAEYLCRNLRQEVRFQEGIETLVADQFSTYLELSPQPVLLQLGQACVSESDRSLWVSSLSRHQGEWEQLLESVSLLYVRGVEVDWKGFDQDYPRKKVELPTYPFERKRFWRERSKQKVPGRLVSSRESSVVHPLESNEIKEHSPQEARVEPSQQIRKKNGSESQVRTPTVIQRPIDRNLLIEKLNQWLVEEIRPFLENSDTVDVERPIMEYGIDSIAVSSFMGLLNRKLGLKVPPAILFEFTRVSEFSVHLVSRYETVIAVFFAGTRRTVDSSDPLRAESGEKSAMLSSDSSGRDVESLWAKAEKLQRQK